MAAQKRKKQNCQQNILVFLNASYPKTLLNQSLNLSYERLLEKREAFGNYFSLKMISKLTLQKIFQKNIQILEAWKPKTKAKRLKTEFFHFLSFIFQEVLILER